MIQLKWQKKNYMKTIRITRQGFPNHGQHSWINYFKFILSKKYNVSAYTDYQEMVLSETVDFVTIATPNSLHYEQALFVLKNKCDVLIEKPVAFSVKEIDDIISIATCLNNIGVIHYNQKSYSTALEYYQKSLKI